MNKKMPVDWKTTPIFILWLKNLQRNENLLIKIFENGRVEGYDGEIAIVNNVILYRDLLRMSMPIAHSTEEDGGLSQIEAVNLESNGFNKDSISSST
ncbi:MAG: hypothetical protein ACHQQQ_02135 [Bacteroidota bacterium]